MERRTINKCLAFLAISGTCTLLTCSKGDHRPDARSWSKLQTGTTQDIAVSFIDENTGLIAGKDIFKTMDGGTSWTKTLASSSGKDFLSIDFIDATNAVAVGDGIIFKSTDGGQHWTPSTPPVDHAIFWGVDFISSSVGLLAEGSGKIYKTIDGGATWTKPDSITTPPLVYIRFVTASIGFASGGQGAILKTTDGGETWTPVAYSSAEVVGTYFMDANVGYTYEHNGIIKKTLDGGSTWSVQTSGVTTPLRSMTFSTPSTGFAIGDDGIILSTIDGTSWKKENSGSTEILTSISSAGTKIFVSGFNGTLLKADK